MRHTMWLAALAVIAALPSPARACGGFFCSTSPIDQSGETIVYGLEADGTLTMSVQIRYAGRDEDFAWILPVPAPPTISLGSEALFTALDRVTAPVFITTTRTDGVCRTPPVCDYGWSAGGFGCMAADAAYPGPFVDAGGGLMGSTDAALAVPDMGVRVFSEGPVGPYDTVVLGASTAMEVIDWLREHDYDIPERSLPLLEPYAEAHHVFVALRLSASRENDLLRPITLRMPTSEACLPLRLTAIATVPDMPITAFFLGSERVLPMNYSHAEIDTADLGFWEGRRGWRSEVSAAVDEWAGGRAFVTEYAGPTPDVPVELPSVVDLAAEDDPATFLRELQARGYLGDALLLEILESHLVPPDGQQPRDFYNCLTAGGASCGRPTSFDPDALAMAIEAQITAPRAEAQALIRRHGRLTRLTTAMNGEEMTVDPVFAQLDGMPDVSNVHVATQVIACSEDFYPELAPSHWEIEGRTIPIQDGRRVEEDGYCAAIGAEPASDDGCDCRAGGGGSAQALVLVAGVLVLVLWRRRHS